MMEVSRSPRRMKLERCKGVETRSSTLSKPIPQQKPAKIFMVEPHFPCAWQQQGTIWTVDDSIQ